MAKIAETSTDGARPHTHRIAQGDGWAVSEFVCTLGPRDRPFEEQHSVVSIAVVASGTFQYRSRAGSVLMTPGSLMLGGAGQSFECSHPHGTGDHCIGFSFTPAYFDRLEAAPAFRALRIPPVRPLSSLVARAAAGTDGDEWEELALALAGRAVRLDQGAQPEEIPASALARVARVVRMLDEEPEAPADLPALAGRARLSPYHFLRTFQAVTGVTPHQYLLRMRLCRAAQRLVMEPGKVLDIALDCGFGDVSNFNRAFRAEFGVSPRVWRGKRREISR